MTTDEFIGFFAKIMHMDERAWERHANPWSVWSRLATFPVFMLALWSMHWIGWWCLIPIALLSIWLWLNPRIFPPPRFTHRWASRAVLGERIHVLRFMHPVPVEHTNVVSLLGIGSAVGAIFVVAGLLAGDPFFFIAGGIVVAFFKLWICDRMVWLFDQMSEHVPEYREWRR